MKKIILALALSALLSLGQITSFAETSSPVTAVDGKVTISAAVDAAEDTPVLVFILPAITDEDSDVTAESVQGITSSEILDTLNVEYVALEYVNSEGRIEHTCVMKDSLKTGVCHVVFSYLGAEEGCYSVGTFEHVGENDKKTLLKAFNDANKDTCAPVIDKDINGVLDTDGETIIEEAKEILRKSSADVAYYNTLDDAEKVQFHELLYKLKGEEKFDLPLLIDSFNKAGIWMRLRLESDTLKVLNTYNGEGTGKYWNLAIGEDSDFASNISETEKTSILKKIKESGYEDKATLETDFHSEVVMALFRGVTTREELADLISADGKYAEDFSDARKIISDAKLDPYKEALFYNAVLDGNKACETMKSLKTLFTESIPKNDGGSGSASPGRPVSSNKGSAITYKNDAAVKTANPETKPFQFKDVESSHWAYSYVNELYKNGTINGVSADEFAPAASVARQDFVKILVGALGIEVKKAESEFSDVDLNSYYAPFVITAFEKGIISGISENSFGVGVSIKREDAAVIIGRVLSNNGFEASKAHEEFNDEENASDYAKEEIKKVSAAGVFSGDENGNFNPKASLSRAEACAIICRLAEILKEV